MINVIENTGKFSASCACKRCGRTYQVKDRYSAIKSPIGHLCSFCKDAIVAMHTPTQESLLGVFNYDGVTGKLTHKKTTSSGTAGSLATHAHSGGYLCVSVGRKAYLAHRIIYLMVTGNWPEYIDHINHDRTDNRWNNLRGVSQTENNRNMSKQSNSTTGYVGVSFMKTKNKYRAYITVDKKAVHLGVFDTIEEAVAARESANIQYGYHANHGN